MTFSAAKTLTVLAFLWSSPVLAQGTGETEPSEPSVEVPKVSEDVVAGTDFELFLAKPPPSLAEGIALVPAGSLILLQQDGAFVIRAVPTKHFLMPRPMYDSALLQARQLKICQPALDAITEETLQLADRTYQTLATCGDQFDADEALIASYVLTIEEMEKDLTRAQRSARVGWTVAGITASVTAGVIAGIAVATSGN